jgi:hypothetical protein
METMNGDNGGLTKKRFPVILCSPQDRYEEKRMALQLMLFIHAARATREDFAEAEQ